MYLQQICNRYIDNRINYGPVLENIVYRYAKFVITRADPIQRRNGICQPQARKATGTVAQPSDSRIFDMERG